jgi:hypothetical protein
MTQSAASKNPIRRIQASGDPFSIGLALGQAAAEDIHDRVFTTEEFQSLSSHWRGSAYLQQLEDAARSAYPRFIQEIEGIAAGAELDFETLFVWNCRGDLRLPDDVSPETLLAAASGCTTVMVPADNDTPAVIAHNEDGAPEFLGHCFWVSVIPDDGPAFDSFMYPGMLPGHTLGVNNAGLVQTINNVRVHDLKPGIPRHIITRAVLGANSMDAALEILQRDDRASGFHHNLGQAGNQRIVSVEAPATGCQVREITAQAAHANHLIDEAFKNIPQSITGSSEDRQASADKMIAAGEGPETILFDRETPVYRANDAGDDYAQTLSTGIFRLHRDRVEWAIHATPDEPNALTGTMNMKSNP